MTDKPINLKALQPIFDDKYLDRKRKARLRDRSHYKKNRVKILARISQSRKTILAGIKGMISNTMKTTKNESR